jgi:hypothetical protein
MGFRGQVATRSYIVLIAGIVARIQLGVSWIRFFWTFGRRARRAAIHTMPSKSTRCVFVIT